ncbi:hypothetical protein CspHIS471_0210450 [Cutaneotrichosporon sp. HIS471]|nr:hypothetical protein CspHIS471_0210450 [Cutaneotrichosporon sp. HIS471]
MILPLPHGPKITITRPQHLINLFVDEHSKLKEENESAQGQLDTTLKPWKVKRDLFSGHTRIRRFTDRQRDDLHVEFAATKKERDDLQMQLAATKKKRDELQVENDILPANDIGVYPELHTAQERPHQRKAEDKKVRERKDPLEDQIRGFVTEDANPLQGHEHLKESASHVSTEGLEVELEDDGASNSCRSTLNQADRYTSNSSGSHSTSLEPAGRASLDYPAKAPRSLATGEIKDRTDKDELNLTNSPTLSSRGPNDTIESQGEEDPLGVINVANQYFPTYNGFEALLNSDDHLDSDVQQAEDNEKPKSEEGDHGHRVAALKEDQPDDERTPGEQPAPKKKKKNAKTSKKKKAMKVPVPANDLDGAPPNDAKPSNQRWIAMSGPFSIPRVGEEETALSPICSAAPQDWDEISQHDQYWTSKAQKLNSPKNQFATLKLSLKSAQSEFAGQEHKVEVHSEILANIRKKHHHFKTGIDDLQTRGHQDRETIFRRDEELQSLLNKHTGAASGGIHDLQGKHTSPPNGFEVFPEPNIPDGDGEIVSDRPRPLLAIHQQALEELDRPASERFGSNAVSRRLNPNKDAAWLV